MRQKVLVFGRSVLQAGNISSIPNICQIGEKRGKKRRGGAFPTSQSHTALNGPQSQKRHHLYSSERGRCVTTFISNISSALLFSSKNGLSSFSHVRQMDELTLPNAGKGRQQQMHARDQRDRGEGARAQFRVQFISHCDSVGFAFSEFGKGVHTLFSAYLATSLPWSGSYPIIHSLALVTNFTKPRTSHIFGLCIMG